MEKPVCIRVLVHGTACLAKFLNSGLLCHYFHSRVTCVLLMVLSHCSEYIIYIEDGIRMVNVVSHLTLGSSLRSWRTSSSYASWTFTCWHSINLSAFQHLSGPALLGGSGDLLAPSARNATGDMICIQHDTLWAPYAGAIDPRTGPTHHSKTSFRVRYTRNHRTNQKYLELESCLWYCNQLQKRPVRPGRY